MSQQPLNPNAPFDRKLLRQRRKRAAPAFDQHDFLLREVGARVLERIVEERRVFPLSLDIGCHQGEFAQLLAQNPDHGVGRLVQCDLSPAMLAGAMGMRVAADEEALPFRTGAFDLVLSILSLHLVNDLPGCLVQIRRSLRPGGLFIGALFGGETLRELHQSLAQAEMQCEGGLSPRIAPFTDIKDAGALLQRAGFERPVADVDTINVSYADPLSLMRELRGMGESNILHQRRRQFLRRETLAMAMDHYRRNFSDDAGRVMAAFQVIYLTGWAPGAPE